LRVDVKVLKRVVKVLLNKTPKEEEKLLKVANDLEFLSELYKRNAEFRGLLLNPQMPYEEKVKVLESISEKANLDKNVKDALLYLVKTHKGNVVKDLGRAFRFEVEKFFATVQGEVITAYKVDENLLNEIKKILENKIGKKVEFQVKEDPSIIGGLIVKTGSYIVDASVKSYMEKLRQQLTKF
jgi:F-type H+-transporting ATPase subunit delta